MSWNDHFGQRYGKAAANGLGRMPERRRQTEQAEVIGRCLRHVFDPRGDDEFCATLRRRLEG